MIQFVILTLLQVMEQKRFKKDHNLLLLVAHDDDNFFESITTT